MNKIICPIDFSLLSKEALHVAAQMAVDFDVELIALHVVDGDRLTGRPMPTKQAILKELSIEEEQLMCWLKNLPVELSALRSNAMVKVGFLTDELNKLADGQSLIVSGTSGMDHFFNKFFGSLTREMFYRGRAPVLVIPSGYHYNPFTRICMATDLVYKPQWDVHQIIALGKKWKAHIFFLSVLDDAKEIDVQSVERSFIHAYLKETDYSNVSFQLNQASSPAKGISTFLREHPTDLLVLTHKERSFWAGLFEKSTSEQFIAHPEIPLLLFHQDLEK